MPTPTPRSTPLENLKLGGEGASLQLEGRQIDLRGDRRDPAVGAFHAFYLGAREDYRARLGAPARPGLLQRVRSWFARLLGTGPASAAPRTAPPEDFASAAPVRSAVLPVPPRRLSESRPEPAATIARGAEPAPPPDRREPQLRSAYADRAGVHLLWHAAADRDSAEKIEFVYGFDSATAHRLQECYGQLTRLGYKVAGLELLRPDAASPDPRPAAVPAPAEPPAVAIDAGKIAAAAPAAPPTEKKERTLVMRLHPAAPEEPHRALVAPVENQANLQVLVAPERLVRALYAAADSAQPPDRRVTYLRCALGKSGLKVVDVGVGEGREREPARWEAVAAWAEAGPELPNPAGKRPRAALPLDPVRAPEPGLF